MSDARRIAVDIPWRTIFKLLAAAALVWLWLTLVELVLVVIVAVLIAVTLNPVVEWFERRGLPRWGASAIVAMIMVVTTCGFLWLTWSALWDQGRYVAQLFRRAEGDLLVKLPPWVRNAAGIKTGDTVQSFAGPYLLRVGQSAASAVVVTVLGFVLTMYLLVEASATREWLVAFVPRAHRGRVQQTLTECERVIFAYVAGNFITSIIATVCTLIALSLLEVPAPLLLALVAGVSDFLPVVGFILGAFPTILLALTVSGKTALIVTAFYLGYNAIENYVISPWVYAGRLRLSNVAVILAFVIGGEVAGVIGALIALPVAAIYPAVEKIWLRETLPEETVREHKAIEHRKVG